MKKFALLALSTLGAANIAFAVAIPYSTGFETTEVPAWSLSGAPASNVDWSGLSNWKTSNTLAYAGTQSLNAAALNTSLPTSTAQPSSISTSLNKGTIGANMKMYMNSQVSGQATGANSVYGFAFRILDNFGRIYRLAIQNNGSVQLYSNFAYTQLGTLSNQSANAFQNQWLDVSMSVDTTLGSQAPYTLNVLDSGGNSIFSKSGNLLGGSTVVTTAGTDYIGLLYSNNGGSGSAVYGNVSYDNFNLSAVPEPASLGFLAIAVTAAVRRRRA